MAKAARLEIALEVESGLVNELLVFGIAVGGRLFPHVRQQSDRFQIDVQDGVGVRKKSDRIGRGVSAQEDGGNNCARQNQDYDKCDPELTPTGAHRFVQNHTGKASASEVREKQVDS